jgi:3-oxoadipate CoA-transferase, beta subunit
MDLAIGAKRCFVMMEHLTREGRSKLVQQCSYPLTGVACVSRIYTDLAVIDVTPRGLVLVEAFAGLGLQALCRLSGVPIADPAALP